jgi:hypothetical protein
VFFGLNRCSLVTVFEQEVVMRHPLAVLAAGVLLASTCAAFAQSGGRPALAKESADVPVSTLQTVPPPPRSISGPVPIGIEADVYCSGYVGEEAQVFPGQILSAEKEQNQTFFMLGDIVYLDIGARDGVQAGMEFTIVRPLQIVNTWGAADLPLQEREISDIHVDAVARAAVGTTSVLGRMYQTPGRVRVICAQEKSAIAEIVYSCMDTQIGDFVVPFEPIPVPVVRRTRVATLCDTPNGKALGHIVETKEGVTPVATDTIVFLDLGEADGLNPGDFLTVFRASRRAKGVRTILGEAAILTTRSRTSAAIITSTIDTMGVGDEVEIK